MAALSSMLSPEEKMILIGSRALQLRFPSLDRKAVDFDFVCTEGRMNAWMAENKDKISSSSELTELKDTKLKKFCLKGDPICEFEIIQKDTTTQELAELVKNDPDTIDSPFGLVPSADLLFTLKCTHKYLKNSPHFFKTLKDYHFLKSKGCKIRPEFLSFFKRREKETYDYKHPSLEVSKDNFFSGDNIIYTWDHDTIHEAIKFYDVPIYKKFLKDGGQVSVSKKKFDVLPHCEKIASVAEEITVLAIERSLVPTPDILTEKKAWLVSFSKVLSSITSGWWREFAYDHAFEVLKAYPKNYWSKFENAVLDGVVKPHKC